MIGLGIRLVFSIFIVTTFLPRTSFAPKQTFYLSHSGIFPKGQPSQQDETGTNKRTIIILCLLVICTTLIACAAVIALVVQRMRAQVSRQKKDKESITKNSTYGGYCE